MSSTPKKFGRYEVVRELGKGAMGIVFLGRDPVIGRLVALKTIRLAVEDDAEEREFRERFLREAQAAGILSHPNIVTVHDVGEDTETETSFIAMEYVEGKNLKELLKEKTPFAYTRIAEIIGQVAEALDYAHRRGIVHRDVKPANIIITPEGGVKITDFGIAKIEKSNLTSTGQFLGTPNYMSPEQVTGEAVDGRSDLFSLGVVLYELLTRKKPFLGDNLTSISYKIVHEAFTPPQTYDAAIPPEFGEILKRSLAKDPASRYQLGRDFALALYEFKAREEERQMLRDLGEMVAEAEKLGSVSAVDLPPPGFAPAGHPSGVFRIEHPRTPSSPNTQPIVPPPPPDAAPASAAVEAAATMAARPAAEPPDAREPDAHEASRPGAEVQAEPFDDLPPTPPPPVGVFPQPQPEFRGVGETELLDVPFAPRELTERISVLEALEGAQALAEGREPMPAPSAELGEASSPGEEVRDEPAPEALEPVRNVPAPANLTPSPGAPAEPAVPPPPPPMERIGAEPPPPRATPPPRPAMPAAVARPDRVAAPASRPGQGRGRGKTVLVAVVVLVLVAAGLAIAKLARDRAAMEPPPAPAEDAAARALAAQKELLESAQKLEAEGSLDDALARYRELAAAAPRSAVAAEGIQRVHAAIAERESARQKAADLQAHLTAAADAAAAGDDAKVVEEVDAALALDPGNAEARAMRSDAEARAARKAADARKSDKTKKPKATPAPVRVAAVSTAVPDTPVPPTATPAVATLRIAFESPIPQGYVMVRLDDKEIFRREFDFGKKSAGGPVEGSVSIASGQAQFKVWVIARDRTVSQYKVFQTVVPGGQTRTLMLELDASRNLSVTLR